MADEKSGETAQHPVPPSNAVRIEDGRVVYFDLAPVFGFYDGVVRITLTAQRADPSPDGKVRNEMVVVGYLRCGLDGAASLRDSLDKTILLATKPQGQAQ